MIILSQDKKRIINTNNIKEIAIGNLFVGEYEVNEELNYAIFLDTRAIGKFKTEERAREILLDIYSKLIENKLNYRIPEE